MTELEKSIYFAIDVLQKQIADSKMAISDLLEGLPYKYIITRTFTKDWECLTASCHAGHKQYFAGYGLGYNTKLESAQFFRSLRDAQYMLIHCESEEMIKGYVKLEIEKVNK